MINRAACVRCQLLTGGKLISRKYVIRAPGEPVSEIGTHETRSDKNNASQIGSTEHNQTMLFAFARAAVAIACR